MPDILKTLSKRIKKEVHILFFYANDNCDSLCFRYYWPYCAEVLATILFMDSHHVGK